MKYFETFAGVGGIGLGLPTEWECVGMSEVDKYASQVLKFHYPKVKNYGDIKTIKWEEVADFDLFTGGSPCQDFSIAGKRRGLAGAKSSLAWEFIRGLRSKKPQYFLWENVKGVMSSRGGWDFANILTAFSESGYSLWWQVLNAKDFGVPQNRERIFVIGFREESPKEVFFERKSDENNNGESGVKLREQIEVQNKGASQHYRVYGEEGLAPTLQSQSGMSSQKHPFIRVHNMQPRSPNRPSLKYSSGGSGHLIKDDGTTYTLDTGNTNAVEIDNQIRKLMPIECERLMSWPDNWTKYGSEGEISDSQRYKMCGNGVVSNVIKEISKQLFQ